MALMERPSGLLVPWGLWDFSEWMVSCPLYYQPPWPRGVCFPIMVVFRPPWNEPFTYITIGSVKILTPSDRVANIEKPLCIVGLNLYNVPLGFWDIRLGFLTCLSQIMVSLGVTKLCLWPHPWSASIKRYVEGNAVLPWPSPFLGIFRLFLMPTTILEDVTDMEWDRTSWIDRSFDSFGCCKTVIPDWPHFHIFHCVGGFPQIPHPKCSSGVASVPTFSAISISFQHTCEQGKIFSLICTRPLTCLGHFPKLPLSFLQGCLTNSYSSHKV